MNKRLDEKNIRKAIHSKLLHYCHRNQNIRVIDELGLDHGKTRIDVAVIKGTLCGIEIKSAQDNLSRLSTQAESYNRIFHRVTLVFAEKFRVEVIQTVPSWWKLVSVTQGQRGGLHLKQIRPGTPNTNIDSASVVKLLWRDEAVDLLRLNGINGACLREPRSVLYGKLLETLDCGSLHKAVCDKLRTRRQWRNP